MEDGLGMRGRALDAAGKWRTFDFHIFLGEIMLIHGHKPTSLPRLICLNKLENGYRVLVSYCDYIRVRLAI